MGAHITTDEARAFYEPFREAFEAGGPVTAIVEATGRDASSVYRTARTLGWDFSRRRGKRTRASRPAWNRPRIEGDSLTCRECGDTRPVRAFMVAGSVRTICRRCTKTKDRRRQGIVPKPPAKPKAGPTVDSLRRQLRTLMRKLLVSNVEATGEAFTSWEWRYKYQNDPEFRERQIARTWARKEASGVLRTDGRWGRAVAGDGSLDSATVRRLFAEAGDCPYCTRPMHPRDKTLDHTLPVSRGGTHSITNVLVCCASCNSSKGTRTIEEWRAAGTTVARGAA